MDGKKKLEELVAGLDGVTPGPWAVDGYSIDAVIYMPEGKSHVSDWKPLTKCATADGHWRHNAAHIARCDPDTIRSIADAYKAMEAENERLAREALSSDGQAHEAHERAMKAEAERDHYKRKAQNAIGFTYQKTGERVTVYAEDRRSLDILLYEPGVVETLRDVHEQIRSGKTQPLTFEDNDPVAISGFLNGVSRHEG